MFGFKWAKVVCPWGKDLENCNAQSLCFGCKMVSQQSHEKQVLLRDDVNRLERHVASLATIKPTAQALGEQYDLYLKHVDDKNNKVKIDFFDSKNGKRPKLIKPSFEGFMGWGKMRDIRESVDLPRIPTENDFTWRPIAWNWQHLND